MQDPTAIRHVHIFGDESSHKGKHAFMVYGTISCNAQKLEEVTQALAFPNFHHEFHWKESGSFLDPHKLFASAIFALLKRRWLDFRCIVVNARHMNHKEFNQNDPDLGLEKYIHRQLLRYALKQPNARFHVVLDAGREEKFPPEQKRRMLNNGFKKESGHSHDSFLSVRTMASKDSRLVQAADVLSGAVAWVRNERYNDKGKGWKKESLVEHIATKANLPSLHGRAKLRGIPMGHYLTFDHPTLPHVDQRGFAIWEFDLTMAVRREQESLSADQVAAIPGQDIRWRDLPSLGYRVRLACAYCGDEVPNSAPDPVLEARRITARHRPTCTKCGKGRVPLLDPDPRHGGLVARMIGPR